jgi:O-antigen/teichoic acid export membrane protein
MAFDSMRRSFRLARNVLLNDRTLFVVVNVGVNILFLVRSYVTMRSLVYSDLGVVALLQTIILLVAALQMGVVNGAYRLVCSESEEAAHTVNNLVYTFVGTLSVVLFAVGALAAITPDGRDHTIVVFLAIFAGVLTILKNWLTNFLIAKVMLLPLNLINLISALLSIAPLPFVKYSPLLICLGSLVLQPLVFVVYVLISQRALRPTRIEWSVALLRRIMSAGFVVFLTGMLLMANSQIERWSILSYLGTDGLGRFYLALVFLNLYTLVPSSLDAIFLPRLVQSYVGRDSAKIKTDMRRFFQALIVYSAAAMAGVLLIARPFLQALLPKYVNDLQYVYLVLPGMVLFGLTAPFAIVFNVLIQYRYYFYAYGVGTLCTAALLGAYIVAVGSINLVALSIIKSIVNVAMGLVIMAGYFEISRGYSTFRFAPFRIRSAPAT